MTDCVFSSYVIFLKILYPQLWSRRWNEIFFRYSTIVGRFLNIVLKILLWILVYGCKFLEKIKKSENSLNFFFYHYQGFSKSLRGNEKFWKVQYSRCLQLDNLFGPIVTSTLNSHQFWRIRSTIVNQNFQWSKSYHTLTFSYLIFYL